MSKVRKEVVIQDIDYLIPPCRCRLVKVILIGCGGVACCRPH